MKIFYLSSKTRMEINVDVFVNLLNGGMKPYQAGYKSSARTLGSDLTLSLGVIGNFLGAVLSDSFTILKVPSRNLLRSLNSFIASVTGKRVAFRCLR